MPGLALLGLRNYPVKEAIEKEVTFTISTDAHALTHFEFMFPGVGVARRGWCN